MNKETKENIDKVVKRGFSDEAIKQMLRELYYAEIIHFDDEANPYYQSCGDPLDPDVELKFKE